MGQNLQKNDFSPSSGLLAACESAARECSPLIRQKWQAVKTAGIVNDDTLAWLRKMMDIEIVTQDGFETFHFGEKPLHYQHGEIQIKHQDVLAPYGGDRLPDGRWLFAMPIEAIHALHDDRAYVALMRRLLAIDEQRLAAAIKISPYNHENSFRISQIIARRAQLEQMEAAL